MPLCVCAWVCGCVGVGVHARARSVLLVVLVGGGVDMCHAARSCSCLSLILAAPSRSTSSPSAIPPFSHLPSGSLVAMRIASRDIDADAPHTHSKQGAVVDRAARACVSVRVCAWSKGERHVLILCVYVCTHVCVLVCALLLLLLFVCRSCCWRVWRLVSQEGWLEKGNTAQFTLSLLL